MGFFDAVRAALGDEAVDVSRRTRDRYGFSRLPGGDRVPSGVVTPASVGDVQAVVRLAAEHGMALWPTSTGRNLGQGDFSSVREGHVALHLGRRMNRIVEIDETLGYAVVEPGVTFAQLRAELLRRGDQFMISSTSGPTDGSILGNALDRGAGYTPYADHFGNLCCLQVVLPDASLLHTGDGTLAGSKSRFVNKSGFGPLLDGLFSQSNLGIVTQAAVWLMPRPPVIRSFGFTFPDDDDIETIIDVVRPLRLGGVVPTLVKVTSDVYSFATEETYPSDCVAPGQVLPDDLRRELRSRHGLGAWLVSGALYGPSGKAVAPILDQVRTSFEATGKAAYLPHEEMVANPVTKIHVDTFSGEPTDRELGLLTWRPGNGLTWFLPATPMVGSTALLHAQTSRRILAAHGFELLCEFVCGPRAARGLHVVPFDREDRDEVSRMNAAYDELVATYDDLGYPIGRVPVDRQEWAIGRLPELARITSALKTALDPHGVLAPGKYGIA